MRIAMCSEVMGAEHAVIAETNQILINHLHSNDAHCIRVLADVFRHSIADASSLDSHRKIYTFILDVCEVCACVVFCYQHLPQIVVTS